MSYALGWDDTYQRWKGYGVPCECEQPDCKAEIDRGYSHICHFCGMYFCDDHIYCGYCKNCYDSVLDDELEVKDGATSEPFPLKPELEKWLHHIETDATWKKWRESEEGRNDLARWRSQK